MVFETLKVVQEGGVLFGGWGGIPMFKKTNVRFPAGDGSKFRRVFSSSL